MQTPTATNCSSKKLRASDDARPKLSIGVHTRGHRTQQHKFNYQIAPGTTTVNRELWLQKALSYVHTYPFTSVRTMGCHGERLRLCDQRARDYLTDFWVDVLKLALVSAALATLLLDVPWRVEGEKTHLSNPPRSGRGGGRNRRARWRRTKLRQQGTGRRYFSCALIRQRRRSFLRCCVAMGLREEIRVSSAFRGRWLVLGGPFG